MKATALGRQICQCRTSIVDTSTHSDQPTVQKTYPHDGSQHLRKRIPPRARPSWSKHGTGPERLPSTLINASVYSKANLANLHEKST